MKLDHIGIAVWNLEEAKDHFCNLFDAEPQTEEPWSGFSGNETYFISIGNESLEVMSPKEGEEGAGEVRNFLEEKGQGIMQMAYLVDSIPDTVKKIAAKGFDIKQLDDITMDDGECFQQAMIEPCDETCDIMVYFFNRHYEPAQ